MRAFKEKHRLTWYLESPSMINCPSHSPEAKVKESKVSELGKDHVRWVVEGSGMLENSLDSIQPSMDL
jgi:hypothetical protein